MQRQRETAATMRLPGCCTYCKSKCVLILAAVETQTTQETAFVQLQHHCSCLRELQYYRLQLSSVQYFHKECPACVYLHREKGAFVNDARRLAHLHVI